MHCVFEWWAEANKPFVRIRCSELIPRDLSVCCPDRLLENAMFNRRTSDLLWGNDNNDDDIKDYRRKTASSSSFLPLLLILSHDDSFLFYWCWTSTMGSRWFAMKIPWAIAPKVQKRGNIFLHIQKRLKEYYVDQNMFIRKWAAMKNFFPVIVLYTKFQLWSNIFHRRWATRSLNFGKEIHNYPKIPWSLKKFKNKNAIYSPQPISQTHSAMSSYQVNLSIRGSYIRYS